MARIDLLLATLIITFEYSKSDPTQKGLANYLEGYQNPINKTANVKSFAVSKFDALNSFLLNSTINNVSLGSDERNATRLPKNDADANILKQSSNTNRPTLFKETVHSLNYEMINGTEKKNAPNKVARLPLANERDVGKLDDDKIPAKTPHTSESRTSENFSGAKKLTASDESESRSGTIRESEKNDKLISRRLFFNGTTDEQVSRSNADELNVFEVSGRKLIRKFPNKTASGAGGRVSTSMPPVEASDHFYARKKTPLNQTKGSVREQNWLVSKGLLPTGQRFKPLMIKRARSSTTTVDQSTSTDGTGVNDATLSENSDTSFGATFQTDAGFPRDFRTELVQSTTLESFTSERSVSNFLLNQYLKNSFYHIIKENK